MDSVLPRSIILPFCFRGCRHESLVTQKSEDQLGTFFEKMVAEAGFTPVARYVKVYENGAYTAEITLEESKAAVYTWPEDGEAEGLIFYCNYGGNNSPKAEKLYGFLLDFFQPSTPEKLDSIPIYRGGGQP